MNPSITRTLLCRNIHLKNEEERNQAPCNIPCPRQYFLLWAMQRQHRLATYFVGRSAKPKHSASCSTLTENSKVATAEHDIKHGAPSDCAGGVPSVVEGELDRDLQRVLCRPQCPKN